MEKKAQFVISCFNEIFKLDPDNVSKVGETIPIPKFSETLISNLISTCMSVHMHSKPLVYISSPRIIIGDLHGSYHDFLRLLLVNGLPDNTQYLFMGDYVDRGPFSLEILTLLMAYKILYPDNVIMLRGNHEFRDINSTYGFKDEIIRKFGREDVYELFNQMFEYLPIAAIIDNEYICLHGGISPNLRKIKQLELFEFPIKDFQNNKTLEDIVWADPLTTIKLFDKNAIRNRGCMFGYLALNDFLQDNGLKCLIRAHQCVQSGIDPIWKERCVTVFSASGYSNNNWSGYLSLTIENGLVGTTLQPIPRTLAADPLTFTCILPDNIELRRTGTQHPYHPRTLKLSLPVSRKPSLTRLTAKSRVPKSIPLLKKIPSI